MTWLWHRLIALRWFAKLYIDDKEPTGICVLKITFVLVSILLRNRPTNYYENGQKSYTAEIFDTLLLIFIYYVSRQHKLKYTDKKQCKHKHKNF